MITLPPQKVSFMIKSPPESIVHDKIPSPESIVHDKTTGCFAICSGALILSHEKRKRQGDKTKRGNDIYK